MHRDFADPAWQAQVQDWVRQAQQGDRRAFGELHAAFAGPLYRQVLLPRLAEPVAAEEALAETFIAALDHLGQYGERGAGFWSWLARIAVNKATDVHRRRARLGRLVRSAEALLAPLEQVPALPDSALHAQRTARALQQRVAQTLAALNPRYRTALQLRFLEELSRAECAARLEVRLGTFDVLLLRALRSFRQAWEAGGAAPQDEERLDAP